MTALGINRAEVYMRKGLFGEVTPVSGIECVGQVEEDPSGTLQHGQTVATITGGHGSHEKRELRRIYLRAFTERLSSPNRSGLGNPRCHPRILRDCLELSLCQFAHHCWPCAVLSRRKIS